MIDLSINICTYNNRDFLRTCLTSIYREIKDITFEVIVVDNGSKDGTVDLIESDFTDVEVIKNNTNHGVAKARNQAIKHSIGRYVLLLDADTELISGNIAKVIKYLDASPKVGLLGVQQLTYNNSPYPAARTFPGVRHVILRRLAFLDFISRSNALKKHHLMLASHDGPAEVDYVIGAFQLIRKDIFGTVGLLDEEMFYGFEDADFCARIKKAGYKVIYYPDVTIKHYVQGLTRRTLFYKTTVKLLFLHFKSYMRFYTKHYDLL